MKPLPQKSSQLTRVRLPKREINDPPRQSCLGDCENRVRIEGGIRELGLGEVKFLDAHGNPL